MGGQGALAAELLEVRVCGCQRSGGTLPSLVPTVAGHQGTMWWGVEGELVGAAPAPADGGGGAGRVGEVVGSEGDGQIGCPLVVRCNECDLRAGALGMGLVCGLTICPSPTGLVG